MVSPLHRLVYVRLRSSTSPTSIRADVYIPKSCLAKVSRRYMDVSSMAGSSSTPPERLHEVKPVVKSKRPLTYDAMVLRLCNYYRQDLYIDTKMKDTSCRTIKIDPRQADERSHGNMLFNATFDSTCIHPQIGRVADIDIWTRKLHVKRSKDRDLRQVK